MLVGAGLAAIGLLAALPALAAENVYTVANYPVEASAENAVTAKERALADAQQSAFRSLLKRLVPVTAFPHVRKLASVQAADLIEGVRVRKERNSRTDYIASFDFSFQSKAVRDLLRREGIPFVDEQAPAVTLVPVWRTAAGQAPREDAAWSGVWKGLDLENSLSPVKLVALRPEVQPQSVAALAGGDLGALRALAAQYNSEYVLLALGESDAATGRLTLTLAGRDGVGGIVLKRQYRIDARDPAYTTELAAVVALRTLEGRWKAIKAKGGVSDPAAAARGDIDLLIGVEFRGMAEWQQISRKLGAVPGVEELEVAGLSARGARVTLRFREGAERLADELAGQGLVLRNSGGNWVLSVQ
jgi:hypothetical protein